MPTEIECVVKSVNLWGLPILEQRRANVLHDRYRNVGEEYAFKLIEKKTDEKTKAPFYVLKDIFGITHRYYPSGGEPERDVNDIFSLVLASIEENEKFKSYLRLTPVYESSIKPERKEKPKYAEPLKDSLKESLFGKEDDKQEFKSSIVFPAGEFEPAIDKQITIILKTIAGFQNATGGKLYIGVNDSGQVCGINDDMPHIGTSKYDDKVYQQNTDGYEQKIRNAVIDQLNRISNSKLKFKFFKQEEMVYCVIGIDPVSKPVFMNGMKLYQRAGNMTQLLKGDEITWFIKERLELNTVNLNNSIQWNEPDVEIHKQDGDIPLLQSIQQESTTEKISDIWYYMTFYKNGNWSYQNNAINNDTVVYELPITKSLRKERLFMCYDNGCVNVVSPYDIIRPKGKNGRYDRKKGEQYQNGWNTNAKILTMFCATENDLIAIYSKQKDGTDWVKIHNTNAISLHGSLHLSGNIIVNPAFDAYPVFIKRIHPKYHHFISSLILKNNQTSQYLGFRKNETTFIKTIALLDKLCKGEASTTKE
ncbi:helix-turn-helix domain-containing protein [Dysgonomonas sp. 521]|uniref:AlbA family DNA-binding domain-containing protein n=1 Tax=Dysgonomonas sp. 521 TaxID=2302932 RepID=UPI0013D4EA45|nr:ATP-binding protein [Dysgonomonas sp. 521]